MPFNPHNYLKENKMTMKNSKNFVRQISESYIQMKLDEERQPLQEMEWWELLKKAGSSPQMYDDLNPNKPWSTNNFVGKRPWREGTKVRPTPGMGPTPSQLAARQELETFRKGYAPRPKPSVTPQTPQVPRTPTGPTTTTRTPFRLPKIPPAALRLLGRANAVAGAALLGWELGTAIDQYMHPPGPKAPPRPFNQQDVLPSPESLYPSPSNAAGGGGGGGGGLGGGGLGR